MKCIVVGWGPSRQLRRTGARNILYTQKERKARKIYFFFLEKMKKKLFMVWICKDRFGKAEMLLLDGRGMQCLPFLLLLITQPR